jgi:VWFA-related protein
MMSRAIAVILAISCLLPAAAQQPVPSQPIGSGVSAVVVDVVVRDGGGRPVMDLAQDDFELREDGAIQSIGAFTVVGAGAVSTTRATGADAPAGQPTAAGVPGSAAAPAGQQFMALVFDRLSPDARPLAYKGALACLESLQENDFVGIFVTDLSLVTVQTYTNDRALIRKALHDVAMRGASVNDRTALMEELKQRDDRGNPLPGDAHPSVPVVASPESIGRPVDGRTSMRRLMDALNLSTHMSWESVTRDHQGYAATNGLLAITSGLGTLPGRKSVVFFAEGLAIPDAVLPHFRSVVTNANRANVSVYTVDTAGLRVHSKDSEIAREVVAMGTKGLEVTADGSNESSLAMLERNEDVLRKDPRTSLSLLADQTGGFLIENSNDLASGFKRVDADRRFHYLLTYTPSNGNFDGRWRTIDVKVPGRRVSIRARSGYLAVRAGANMPLLAYEGPALVALDRTPAPTDLPVRTAALVFPGGAEDRIAVLASIDAGALRFDSDAARNVYRTDFTVLARIRDAQGQVVKKASQPYRLSGPLDRIQQARAGEVLFFRQPSLTPGTYTLETVIHDGLSGRAGVRRTPFTVPERSAELLNVSSLVLVRRAERVPVEDRDKENPLYAGDILLYPNIGDPLSKARDKVLTFFAVIAAPLAAALDASLELKYGERMLATMPIALAPPDRSGRIEHVARMPIDALPAGHYTARLRVRLGGQDIVRAAAFELID